VETAEEIVTDIKDGVEELVEKKNELKLAVMKPNAKVAQAYVPPVDADKVCVLQILGKNAKAESFYTEVLSKLSMPSVEIRKFIEKILQLKVLDVETLLGLQFNEVKALTELVLIGNVKNKDFYDVYKKLSDSTQATIGQWFEGAYLEEWGSKDKNPAADDGAGVYGFKIIAKHYIRLSAKDFPTKTRKCLNLLRIVVILMTACPMPKIYTLKLGIIWYGMIRTMVAFMNPYRERNYSPNVLGSMLLLNLMVHLVGYELRTNVNIMGKLLTYCIRQTPQDAKEWLARKTGVKWTEEEGQKYLCWNKTLEVLADIPGLTEDQAGRMLATYSLAMSAKYCFERNLNICQTLRSLSPLPDKRTIFEIITFYRDENKYLERKKKIFTEMDKNIKELMSKAEDANMTREDYLEKRFSVSYMTYVAVLKLKVAFCPGDFCKGVEGCFIDPMNLDVNQDVIEEVAGQQYIRGSNIVSDRINLMKYKSKLKSLVKNCPTNEYIGYFGKPRNVFFGFGHKVNYYMNK